MNAREIKQKLREGLNNIDQKIESVIDAYSRKKLSAEEYLDRRAMLESEKQKKVMENLRKMRSLPE
ncbi:MAG: hypothetical protein J7J94_03925 [Thaumarchaeota archaeon]|nr:hypothetical protein [Nitrososphaerota archaeon]